MLSRRPKLLIVDDEVDTCENLSDILTDNGYVVDIAQDGPTALGLAEQNGYDVALLDLRMPGMDGLELYRRIKRVSAGTVAIVVSAYAGSETARSILEAGAWRIVPKPVNVETLLKLVSEAICQPLVLLVDDDTEFGDNLWEILRTNGYRVHLAHDAADANKALRKNEFQVVLLDMKLPDRSGDDLVESIRESNYRSRTVIISGFADEMKPRIEKALAAGAHAVFHKPIEAASLLAAVGKLLECR
jgi:DNA-binding response OmpR family regulator